MGDTDIEDIVHSAITKLLKGESKEYNALNALLADQSLDNILLAQYIKGLKRVVQYITREHETLIGVVLNIDWSKLDKPTIDVLTEFIADLISAKTFYLRVCLSCLIRQFVPKCEVFDTELVQLRRKCDGIHNALTMITTLAPISSKYIAENITKHFPYVGKTLFTLETYIVNILQISTYVPQIRLHTLSLCIDKLLSIDVRIPKNHLCNNFEEEELQFELMNITNETKTDVNITKLDQLMVILFTYVNSLCHVEENLDILQAEQLFKELLLIYDGVILKTQQSLHVQFVLFYVASFHQDFSIGFINCCWKILQDPNVAGIIRQASSGYLSSFLARAKFIQLSTIKSQLTKLSGWIHRYIDLQDSNNINADFDKHGPFYSSCQALFYVFIYHHKQLLDSCKGIEFIKSLNFIRIVTSKLNPLKFCLNTVVDMFARITRMYEIVFCYSIIERNSRNALTELTFASNNVVVPANHMEMFFPFDPYLLPKSKAFITPLYLEWVGSLLDDGSDENESDSEVDSSIILTELHLDKHGNDTQFDMMCVSPGFTLAHHEF